MKDSSKLLHRLECHIVVFLNSSFARICYTENLKKYLKKENNSRVLRIAIRDRIYN